MLSYLITEKIRTQNATSPIYSKIVTLSIGAHFKAKSPNQVLYSSICLSYDFIFFDLKNLKRYFIIYIFFF